MRLFSVTCFVITLLFLGISSYAETPNPVLEPQSAETPNCPEKCLASCMTHCKLECLYDCKCKAEGAESESCRSDCAAPCTTKCQSKECNTEICAKQCQV